MKGVVLLFLLGTWIDAMSASHVFAVVAPTRVSLAANLFVRFSVNEDLEVNLFAYLARMCVVSGVEPRVNLKIVFSDE